MAVRERLAFGKAGVGLAARRLLENHGAREAVLLSTCNRTEVYAAAEHADPKPLVRLLLDCGVPEKELAACVFAHHDREAAHHLHRVAAGLDSMVLGEAQILGQVKEALALATAAGTAGATLDRLFCSAVTAGKRVRTETALARGAVSISHAAVELARKVFGSLRGLHAMILGAGEMSKVTARLLANDGVASIFVANRTFERAQQLAQLLGGKAVRFDEFPKQMLQADMVVCSTAAPTGGAPGRAAPPGARRGRPLLIDIAVPRDVEPAVGELDGVFLFCIDDLQAWCKRTWRSARRRSAPPGDRLRGDGRFVAWLKRPPPASGGAAAQERGGGARRTRQDGWAPQHLSERDRELVEVLARGVAKRLLREPILAVKRFAAAGEPRHPLDTVQDLFGLAESQSAEASTGEE